jgi:hypothetical protein
MARGDAWHMTLPDPRLLVEAPVRRALAWLILRGVALVGMIAALAACPHLLSLDVATCDRLAMAAPAVLLGYVALVYAHRLLRGRVSDEARAEAWDRAKAVDADDAALGLLVTGWVPVGLFVALFVVLWPHLTDANPALAASWAVFGVPTIVLAWLLASSTWLDASRDDLARAEGDSDAALRRYWANVGR